jgi:hypothetical protein
MKSRQDGKDVPPYAAETAREIGNLGSGGRGNFEGLSDALHRGVTPGLVTETKLRGVERTEGEGEDDAAGGMEPSSREPHSPVTEPQHARNAMTADSTQKIREKAYELWVLEGRPEGRELDHWDMARELVAQEEGGSATLLPVGSGGEEIEDAVAALDNEGEAPGLIDQGKDDSDALRMGQQMQAAPASRKKAGRAKL